MTTRSFSVPTVKVQLTEEQKLFSFLTGSPKLQIFNATATDAQETNVSVSRFASMRADTRSNIALSSDGV